MSNPTSDSSAALPPTSSDSSNTVPFFLNGAEHLTSKTFPVTSPGTNQYLYQSASAQTSDAEAAVAAAAAALPAWRALKPAKRAAILVKTAEIMNSRHAELAGYLTSETGAIPSWADFNLKITINILIASAARVHSVEGIIPTPAGEGSSALIVKEPFGVVLAIAPWNAPYILGVRAIAGPLVTGNTVVLKGPEVSPRVTWAIASCFHEAGLPHGVLNTLAHDPSDAPAVTAALIAHRDVKKINFTGSTGVGRIIGRLAGEHLKPVLLELGGKAPAIVWEDADLQLAAQECARGAFRNAGQICMSTERIVVHKAVSAAFESALRDAISNIFLIADAPALIASAAVTKNKKLVRDAVAQGARVIAGDPNADEASPTRMRPVVLGGLLVFGGENEHRTYLSDLIVFDLKTAHWTMPQTSGPKPKGRARHAAVLHEDKLFIVGGITGNDNYVLDDICYLDLKTFTWSRSWRFVGRFDHSVYIWNDRVWVFGGMGEDMDKTGDLWWLDLKGSPAFDSAPNVGIYDRNLGTNRAVGSPRPPYSLTQTPAVGTSGYAANSRTQQVNPPSFQMKTYAPPAPGTISSLKFVGGPSIPPQGSGIHFHVYSSGTLLDFVTPAVTTTSKECSLSALDLQTLRWQKLAEGREIFKSGYRWHYCTMNEDGTKAWLLGCPTDPPANDLGPNGFEEYLSDIMEIDLRKYGFLGNHLASEPVTQSRPTRAIDQPSRGLGADLASLFDQPPESGSGADFVITALAGGWPWDEESMPRSGEATPDQNWLAPGTHTSQPIHCFRAAAEGFGE
ncbi:hypothetical protein BN1723_008058 [Verticillium longisporum]|uniref:Aldehyde dehydrogenase domain-containing protein n=1 Tax=Verticillium longisporum TaxID=100787 RepID=A0A0G4NPU3_VERLO|nr:hypothetical protein BN1723_008058 [Verticillium longisporum]